MTQGQNVFKRYEKKYLLNQNQYRELKRKITSMMEVDEYGLHKICNIYFDTDAYDLIRTSLEKPTYKEKLRIRSYGIPKLNDMVFLELKKKYKGIVYKRRVRLTLEEAQNFLLEGKSPKDGNQVIGEINWFLKSYSPIPKAYISYDRCALFGREDPNLRITFDQNITYRDTCLDLSKGSWGTKILKPGTTLMEIKIPECMPLWLSQILAELEIFPTSFSKYGTCYKEHIIYKKYLKGGDICA